MISATINTKFGKVHLYRERYKNSNDYIDITLRIGKDVYNIGYIGPSYGEYAYTINAKELGLGNHYYNSAPSINAAFDEVVRIIQYRYDDMARR